MPKVLTPMSAPARSKVETRQTLRLLIVPLYIEYIHLWCLVKAITLARSVDVMGQGRSTLTTLVSSARLAGGRGRWQRIDLNTIACAGRLTVFSTFIDGYHSAQRMGV